MPDVSLNGIEFVIKGSSDEASDSIDGLVNKLGELANAIKTAFNSAAFGGIGKKAKKEVEPLDAALQDLIRNADKATQLKGKLDGLSDSLENAFKDGNEKKAWGIQGQILSTEAALDKFNVTPLSDGMQDLISNANQITILENKLLSLRDAMQAAFESGNVDKAFGFRAQIIQAEAALEKARAAAEKTAPAIKEVGNAAKKASSPLSSFVASIKRIAMYRAIRSIIKSIAEALKEGAEQFYNFTKNSGGQFANYAAALDKVKSATSIMKAQLGAAWGTLYANIAPVIESLVDLVTRFANVLTMVFARLSGSSGWYKATTGAAEAIAGVGGAAKEALKYLAPFDELNRLPSNNGGGGGGSSSGSGAQYEWVDFEQFDIGDGIASIFDWMKDAFNNVSAWIESVDWMNLASNIVTALGDAFGKVDWTGLTQSVARFLGAALGAVSAFLVGALADLVTSISDAIYNAFHNDDGTLKTGEEIWNGICTGIKNAIANVKTWVKTNILDPFVKGFKAAFGIASPAKEMNEPGKMVGEGILSGIAGVFSNIKDWVKTNILDKITGAWDTLVKDIKLGIDSALNIKLPDLTTFKKTWDSIKSKTATLTAKLAGTKEKVFTTVKGAWDAIKTKAASLTASLKKDFTDATLSTIKGAWDSLKSKTAKLTASLKGTAASTFTSVKNAFAGINTKSSTLTASLKKNFVDSTLNSIKDAWSSLGNKTAKLTASLSASSTVQNFISGWNKLTSKTLSLKAELSDNVKATWNKAATAWNNSWLAKSLGTLPTLAKGGIVDQATFIGNAIVGEAGKEAIVPLERNTEWVGMVANGLAKSLAQTSGGFDYAAMGEAMYAAMSRALSENTDDRDIVLDGDVVYRKMVQRNRKETFLLGVNPMMA